MTPTSGSWWRISLWVIVVAITLWFLFAVRSILPPFILAFLISVLLEPVIQKMIKRGVRRPFAVFSVIFLFFVSVGGVLVVATPAVSRQISTLSTTLDSMAKNLANETESASVFYRWNPVDQARPSQSAAIDRFLESNQDTLKKLGIPATRAGIVKEYVEPHRGQIGSIVKNFFNGLVGILGTAASQVFLLLFTPIFVAMILGKMDDFRKQSVTWIPPSIRRGTLSLLSEVGQVIISYIRGMMVTIAIWTTVSAIVLFVLGVPYSFLLAVLFGAVYIIPYVGGVVMHSCVFFVTYFAGTTSNMLFSMSDPVTFAATVLLLFAVCFFTYDSLINPRIIGDAVGLNPLVSMFVVFSGGAMLGLVGMLIAYPLAGTIKVILNRLLRVTSSTEGNLALPVVPMRHQNT